MKETPLKVWPRLQRSMTSVSRQYLTKEQIHNLLGEVHTQGFSLVSTDSYNEQAIAEKIKSLGSEARDILFEATLNNAIIGYGQKNLGVVKIEDKYLEIHDIYQKFGVSINNPPGSNLAEDELTPNRLMRFFRHYIRDWIKTNKVGSYVWRKYSSRDPTMMEVCFRGAEYLEDLTQQQADYLILTTVNMDRVLGTNMIDRVLRAFDARGQIYTPVTGQALLSGSTTGGGGGAGANQSTTPLPAYSGQTPVLPTHPVNVRHTTTSGTQKEPKKVPTGQVKPKAQTMTSPERILE
eukprot:TRINITY_DN19806_c0_g1_i1.p1 TRINITY_DN19806_c0_g1~~TRINITY_DN19806_c0_g1_i1.p1  ORF type:complete len:293 (-),score=52.89 TRINITY_DN19806_c0_g1_i1:27-905(-)